MTPPLWCRMGRPAHSDMVSGTSPLWLTVLVWQGDGKMRTRKRRFSDKQMASLIEQIRLGTMSRADLIDYCQQYGYAVPMFASIVGTAW